MSRKRIVLLGATGSIGASTVDVVRSHRDEFELVGQYIYFLSDVMKQAGDTELAKLLTDSLVALVDEASAALGAS